MFFVDFNYVSRDLSEIPPNPKRVSIVTDAEFEATFIYLAALLQAELLREPEPKYVATLVGIHNSVMRKMGRPTITDDEWRAEQKRDRMDEVLEPIVQLMHQFPFGRNKDEAFEELWPFLEQHLGRKLYELEPAAFGAWMMSELRRVARRRVA